MVLTIPFFSIKHYSIPGQSNKSTVTIWQNYQLPGQTFYNNIQRLFFFLPFTGVFLLFFLVMGNITITQRLNKSFFVSYNINKKQNKKTNVNSWSKPSPSPHISGQRGIYAVFCWPFLPIRDLWMCGMTPANSNMQRSDKSMLELKGG